MKIIDAVVTRMNELREEKKKSIPDSALRVILRKDCETVTLKSIQSICEELETDVRTFFDSPLFTAENISA